MRDWLAILWVMLLVGCAIVAGYRIRPVPQRRIPANTPSRYLSRRSGTSSMHRHPAHLALTPAWLVERGHRLSPKYNPQPYQPEVASALSERNTLPFCSRRPGARIWPSGSAKFTEAYAVEF